MQDPSERPSDSNRPICPALTEADWGDASSLRGEIYGSEHLVAHAAEIARVHGDSSLSISPGPLRKRFAEARARLRDAYAILSSQESEGREPSPAEEWLLDNSHVVEEQIREIQEDLPWGYLRKLPRVGSGSMRGYPRVYGLCLDYLRHTDARVELGNLANYVRSYQSVAPLTVGELWAIPIMLRLGLTLTVGAHATSEASARDQQLADEWAERLLRQGGTARSARTCLDKLESSNRELNERFVVRLLKALREHEVQLAAVGEWIRGSAEFNGATPEELTRRQHLRQAADQVSVGNAITSMRAISALDWTDFFELTSQVEGVLRRDPCGAYGNMDAASRDACRHAIERLARRSTLGEVGIAEAAVGLAQVAQATGSAPVAETHVGYFLLDSGKRRLETAVGYRPRLGERLRAPLLAYPSVFYFGAILSLVGALCALAGTLLWPLLQSRPLVVLSLLVIVLPASELAISLCNALLVFVLPPRVLPKLDFEEGIPDEHRTLVVVPALLDGRATVLQLLESLELRSLANQGKNLHFALVTDFVDSAGPESESDAELLELAASGIAELNRKFGSPERYALLHRKRLANPSEGCFMGWERKRGKLEELNRLLRGATDTSFTLVTAERSLLESVRYVITLDADTDLPREVARKLVGTMAHPRNRPVLDPTRARVVRGHAIIQPRVGTLPESSRRSRFARIFSGAPGIDPYTTAVSDVYQDLFGEGSFVGKGIYDVDAFSAALRDRVPDNRMLSHDLFEGSFARSALATDIEVLDEQPATYGVVTSREHRWLRGDWQLLPWLLPWVRVRSGARRPNDLRLLDFWKMGDNLRRSLLPIALVLCSLVSWFALPELAPWVSLTLLAVFIAPVLVRYGLALARASTQERSAIGGLGGDVLQNLQQLGMGLLLLLDQALLASDAIGRTLYRLFISKRNLLEWTTMHKSARRALRQKGRLPQRQLLGSASSLGCLLWLCFFQPSVLPFAAPLLAAWVVAPWFVRWLGRARPAPEMAATLTADDRQKLRQIARKTWRFFDTFVGAEDNYLPPDNYQEDPRGVIAHRTSPTNIGLYLLTVTCARDFGFISAVEAVRRLEQTLGTLWKLERRSGHILNWYETTTLRPLEPQYISTVDSGNLAAYLWTLRQAALELRDAPLLSRETFEAVSDALLLSIAAADAASPSTRALVSAHEKLRARLESLADDLGLTDGASHLEDVESELMALLNAQSPSSSDDEQRYWLEQAAKTARSALDQARTLAPFFGCLEALPSALDGAQAWPPLRSALGKVRSPRELCDIVVSCQELLLTLKSSLAGDSGATGADRAAALGYVDDLHDQLRLTASTSLAFCLRAERVAESSGTLGDGMDFRVLYNSDRELFSIGYNVASARLDGGHYDLLASEARLASLVAISKGDAPVEHWWRLARPRSALRSGRVLMSWSGSMFEFLMPLLVTGANRDTLLRETCESAIAKQREYGAEHKVPWGVSEAAYNIMDLSMTYQYRAFGVPGLGLKGGLGDDLVIAPYATALSALVNPALALENFHALDREGLFARFGYWESIDYTPRHVPPKRRSVIVKTFMAHHQGMSLLAMGSVLHGEPMKRRFFADARVRASALLLEERVPKTGALDRKVPTKAPPSVVSEAELDLTDNVGLESDPLPRVHLLGHGQLSSLISAEGGGVTTWKGLDVTRFREDASLESGGTYIYLRDLKAKRLWSAGFQPTRTQPSSYNATFAIDRVELGRRDGSIETSCEITVSPEHPAEVRRITLTNRGKEPRVLDITTYTEAVLAPRAADVAHRAFSSMFIDTELLPERGAILARRRPRGENDAEVWMLQVLSPESGEFEAAEFECSRARFIGRGRNLEQPLAMDYGKPLSGTSGTVLDPGLAIRRRLKIPAGKQVRVTLTTALSNSREQALELLDLHAHPAASARAFELAWADARVELKHLGVSAAESHRFQRLLSTLIYPRAALRDHSEPEAMPRRGARALWAHGISGDLPIVLLRVDDSEFSELVREVLLAHEFWRLNGMVADLVLLNEEPSGYLQPVNEALHDLVRSSAAQGQENQRGGVFVRRLAQLADDERLLLLRAARVVLKSSQGSLSQQLRRALEQDPLPKLVPTIHPAAREATVSAPAPASDRSFWNGIGGFSADGREYVMNLAPGAHTPAPWCNVMANETFGTVISESGSGFTWCGNSQRCRLTPWSNDAVSDTSGEVVYMRDAEDGSVWSATPEPASPDAHFVVRHGQGATTFEHTQNGIRHELRIAVSPVDPAKVLRLRLQNTGSAPRRLVTYALVEWVLGSSREASRLGVRTRFDAERRTLFADNAFSPFPEQVAFLTSSQPPSSVTGDRQEFFGLGGSRSRPVALGRGELSGRTGIGLDPCGALEVRLTLLPGQTVDVFFTLGQAPTLEDARNLATRYADAKACEAAQTAALDDWNQTLSAIEVKTPDQGFDVMVNRWLLYQVASARLWARSGFYQSSGAYGFRDQLQDVLSLLHTRPEVARQHILRAAARQFVEGDVQHWWHPESGEGVRTHCSDDMLWLPFAVAEYVKVTSDYGLLDESLPFLEERRLTQEESDLFGSPRHGDRAASLYEHCVRALRIGATAGPHGIPKMGGGDWNDGMSRMGSLGIGESVWLGWFLARTLQDFAVLAERRDDAALVAFCSAECRRLAQALEEHAWDGDWYRRAYCDDGSVVGSKDSKECQIDAIAQSWAVISGIARPERARRAVFSSLSRLVREETRSMLLLTPPFASRHPDPGYIAAYPAGIRENGGQYTHGVLWSVEALCQLGEGTRASELLSLLNPVYQGTSPQALERYKVEPYVVAADIYSSPEHPGRGGWTWYTGSAAWMYRIAVGSVLGVRKAGTRLELRPCIPDTWPGFEVTYRYGKTEFHIVVENPDGVSQGVRSLALDGKLSDEAFIALNDDGERHEVKIVLGAPSRASSPQESWSHADI